MNQKIKLSELESLSWKMFPHTLEVFETYLDPPQSNMIWQDILNAGHVLRHPID